MADDVVYIDFEDGSKRVMNNTKLYVKLLTMFKTDTSLNNLDAALTSGDMEKARSEAHTLKGLAANLSLMELFKQCLELETQIKSGSVAVDQMAIIKNVFTRTLTEVEKVIAQNGN
ncbi:MAG: Hpt domain-containing protein [Treponema sp.]|jgi:HPt (histidine-containing phosphotransfer) domain-containing protein|nr:Hpt domain-containing protein [Treponema sp.]